MKFPGQNNALNFEPYFLYFWPYYFSFFSGKRIWISITLFSEFRTLRLLWLKIRYEIPEKWVFIHIIFPCDLYNKKKD